MAITIRIPELDVNRHHLARIVHVEERQSRSGSPMLTVLLRTDDGVSINGYVLFNNREMCLNFARALNLPIKDGVLQFEPETLIDSYVMVKLRARDDGSYLVARFYPATEQPKEVKVADLDEEVEGDPFAEQ